MRLVFFVVLVASAIIVGWLTGEYWFGIGLFIGGMVSFWIVYEDEPANWAHLIGKGEGRHGSRKNKGNHLLAILLGVFGMAWLLGKDDEEE